MSGWKAHLSGAGLCRTLEENMVITVEPGSGGCIIVLLFVSPSAPHFAEGSRLGQCARMLLWRISHATSSKQPNDCTIPCSRAAGTPHCMPCQSPDLVHQAEDILSLVMGICAHIS